MGDAHGDGARRWNGKRVGHAAKRHRASRTQDAGARKTPASGALHRAAAPGCPLLIAKVGRVGRAGDDAPRARGARARRHFCLNHCGGGNAHAGHASQRAGPATLGAPARSCRGPPREPRPPTSAGMSALTVVRSRAALDKRETRVTRRERAAARDRIAPFCELYLRACAGHADCGAHHVAARNRPGTATASGQSARRRRQRPRRQRRDGCEQKAARRHRFLCVHGHVSSLPLFDDSRSRFHKKINL